MLCVLSQREEMNELLASAVRLKPLPKIQSKSILNRQYLLRDAGKL